MPKDISATIRGKRYKICHKINTTNDTRGMCDNPSSKNKAITIFMNKLEDGSLEQLEVYLHEMLHAAFWDIEEDGIYNAADDIAKILWKLGYRKIK